MKKRRKLAQVPATSLPTWTPARSLQASAARITGLGRRMDRDRYLLGKEFLDVKERIPYGKWLPWIEEHLDCSEDTVERWMRFAERCDDEERLVPYREKPPTNSAACGMSRRTSDTLAHWKKVITRVRKLVERATEAEPRGVMLTDLKAIVAELEGCEEVPSNVVAMPFGQREQS